MNDVYWSTSVALCALFFSIAAAKLGPYIIRHWAQNRDAQRAHELEMLKETERRLTVEAQALEQRRMVEAQEQTKQMAIKKCKQRDLWDVVKEHMTDGG